MEANGPVWVGNGRVMVEENVQVGVANGQVLVEVQSEQVAVEEN